MKTEKDLSHIQEGYSIQEGFESHEHAMNSLSQCRNPVLLSEYINGLLSVKQVSEMSEFKSFLPVLEENYNAMVRFGKSSLPSKQKAENEAIQETLSDLIEIYKAKYLPQPPKQR